MLASRSGEEDYSVYREDPIGFIEDVLDETLTDDLREICESVAKYPVTIAQSGNGTGKSWISSRLAVWFLKTQERPQVYCAAAPPESNLRNILWAEISGVQRKHEHLFDGCKVNDLRIEVDSLSFLTGVNIPSSGNDAHKQARFSGKHAPSLMFITDEADAIPDAVFDGIETCMSGGFTRLLCMFNPRQRLGAVYRMVRDNMANIVKLSALNHPNVVTGKDVIPGAVTREKTIRRIAQWTRPLLPGETKDARCFELPDFLVGAVPVDQQGTPMESLEAGARRIVVSQFSHVVLGEYPAQADNQLISEEWVAAARSRYDSYTSIHGERPPLGVRCVAGLDIAEQGVDSSALCKRYGGFVPPLKVWEGEQDVIVVGDRAVEELEGEEVAVVNCDGTGVGSGTAPHMQRLGYPAVSVKVASSSTMKTELGEFRILRDQLLWSVREWLKKGDAMIPPDELLVEELLILTYEVKNGKISVSTTDDIKKQIKRSPDRLMALAFTHTPSGAFSGVDLS